MDIKSKRSKEVYIINIVAVLAILIISVGIFSQYPAIKKMLRAEDKDVYANEMANSDTIARYNTILYKNYVMIQNPELNNVEDIFIDKYSEDATYNEAVKANLKETLNSWEKDITRNYKNLEYAVLDKDKNSVKTNTNEKLDALVKDEDFESLAKIYEWFTVINYNELGVLEVKSTSAKNYGSYRYSHGIQLEDCINNQLTQTTSTPKTNSNNQTVAIQEVKSPRVTTKAIKNFSVVYGIKKDLKYDDKISKIINDDTCRFNTSNEGIAAIITIIITAIMFVSLLVPYKISKESFIGKTLLRVPFEITLGIAVVGSIGLVMVFYLSMLTTISGQLENFLINARINERLVKALIIVGNIGFLSMAISFIFAGITYIKNVFKIGIIKYFKENTLLCMIIRGTKNIVDRSIKYLTNINLTSKSNKTVLRIVLINFGILSIISLVWVFGVGAAIIYSVILFILLRRYVAEIKSKYQVLLRATNEIGKGNLDVKINEDLGLFNPFKNELQKIQEGFKKAVQKEVKSERMKTELISNVSHDLKTPLTSIITYTDLLKNGNPNEEERQLYIDTIEKKSKRLKILIEDLFEMSKATSGDVKLNIIEMDMVGLIKQTEVELQDKLENAHLIIKNTFSEDKMILRLDAEKTYRIFENLLSNVSKYSIPNSRVYIDVKEFRDCVEILIKNTSIVEMNFSEEEIVDRFVRGDKSRNTEGSGIGLAIAKSFTEIQGGRFKIEIDGDLFKVRIIFPKPGCQAPQ